MANFRNHTPKPTPISSAHDLVVAVGWRVFIHSPEPSSSIDDRIHATNADGAMVPNDLTDGQEVEVTAWQPRSRDGVLYRVKRLQDGAECWLRAMYLRKARVRPSIAVAARA